MLKKSEEQQLDEVVSFYCKANIVFCFKFELVKDAFLFN